VLSQTIQIVYGEQRLNQKESENTQPSESLSVLYDGESPGTAQTAGPVDLAHTPVEEVIKDPDNAYPSKKEPIKTSSLGTLPSREKSAKVSQSPPPTPWRAEIDGWKKKTATNSSGNTQGRMQLRESGSRQMSSTPIFAIPKVSYRSVSTATPEIKPRNYGGLYHPSQLDRIPDAIIPTVASKYTKAPPLDQKGTQTSSINPKAFEGRCKPNLSSHITTNGIDRCYSFACTTMPSSKYTPWSRSCSF
jgi:hypothetical protein